MLRVLRANDLSPYKPGGSQVFASTGFVGAEASRWWGSAQAVLSLANTQLKAAVSIAPPTYNVPAHLADYAIMLGGRVTLKDAVLVHYRWLLDTAHIKEGSILDVSSALPPPVFEWLKEKTPLAETYP